MNDIITNPPATPATPAAVELLAAAVDDTRQMVEEALRFYDACGHGRDGRVTALDLASNVQGWTHTTRLRDYVRAALKKARS